MSITCVIFKIAKKLPTTLAIIFCQTILLLYLLIQKKYRVEIKNNYQKIFGNDSIFKGRNFRLSNSNQSNSFWVKLSQRLGKNFGLMLKTGKEKKILDKTLFYGENILCNLMENNPKAVVVSFHYGLWEFLPQIFQKLGYEIFLIANHPSDKNLANELNKFRSQNGIKVIKTITEMKHCLRQTPNLSKKLFGFVLDNTSKTRGYKLNEPWVGFSVLRTPFILAQSEKIPLLSMFCYGQKDKIVVAINEVNNPEEVGCQLRNYLEKHPEEWIFWGKRRD